MVRFDHDAQTIMVIADAGPEIFGAGRAQATAAIAAHASNPAGTTSIGDGVENAANLLDAVAASYDATAMIVLTDGQENAPKLIADVAGSIDDTVFAIGLGEPSAINPQKLTDLTNGTGGYVVVTGNISSDEYFTLAKYYLQILAGVSNEEVVLDPEGHLRPAGRTELPFFLTRADAGADVILLCPAPEVMEFELETPGGVVIRPSALPAGVRHITGKGVTYFRFTLPVVDGNGVAAWSGRWKGRLHCERGRFAEYLRRLEATDPAAFQHAAAHGLRYAVEVHARTAVRMTVGLRQKGIDLGDEMHLRVALTEVGLPVENRAEVVVELDGPQGTGLVALAETGPGVFTASVTGDKGGLYRFRVIARGKTLRGDAFTRERRLTGAIYVPRPPQQEGDPDRPGGIPDPCPDLDPGCIKALVALHDAIEGTPFIARALAEVLRRQGHDLARVLECLRLVTGRDAGNGQPTRPGRVNWADVLDALGPGSALLGTDTAPGSGPRPVPRDAVEIADILRRLS